MPPHPPPLSHKGRGAGVRGLSARRPQLVILTSRTSRSFPHIIPGHPHVKPLGMPRQIARREVSPSRIVFRSGPPNRQSDLGKRTSDFFRDTHRLRATQRFWDCPTRPIYGMIRLTTTYGTGSPVNLADAEPCLNEGAAVFLRRHFGRLSFFSPAGLIAPACGRLGFIGRSFGRPVGFWAIRRLPSARRRKNPSSTLASKPKSIPVADSLH